MSTYTEAQRLYWQSERGKAKRKAFTKTQKYKDLQARYRATKCSQCGRKRSLNIPKPQRANYICYYCKHPENMRVCKDCNQPFYAYIQGKQREARCKPCKSSRVTYQQLADLRGGISRQAVENYVKKHWPNLPQQEALREYAEKFSLTI